MPTPPESPPADPVRATLARALGTHYRVDRLLGRGGMGAVYLAHEAGLDREVAIKVLPPERATAEATRERFRREARTAARLNHPHIVPLHAFGEHEDTAYYVMGYVRGESLAGRLRREGPLPEEEARRIATAVAEALQFAHLSGVVHRDVKPDNVLLEEGSGRPLLTDFGIARLEHGGGSLTGTGSVVGTPDFMSPEQAAGRPDVDARSDVYSLGVMAYAMLSGRLPFEASTPGEALARRLTEEPAPLRKAAPRVSEQVAAAVMKCLARDPARRWPDAASFARALAPAGVDDDELGEAGEVRHAASHGLVAVALGYFAVWARVIAANVPAPGFLLRVLAEALPLLAAFFLVLPAGAAFHEWRHGRPPLGALRVAFLEPAFWQTWFPRPLRRASDVWDRLPPAVRGVRIAFGLVLAVVLGLVAPAWFWLLQFDHSDPRTADRLLASPLRPIASLALPATLTAVATVFVLTAATVWLGRRLGLEDEEGGLFVFGAPLSRRAFWSRPAVAARLAPAGRSARTAGPTHSLPAEVAAHWPEGDGAPVTREEALRLARQAAEAVAARERDEARLRRGFDTEEAERLARRLASLGEPAPDEPPDQMQLRELLARQLELHRAAERQAAEARASRDRLRDRLVALRDEAARPAARPEAQRARLEACLSALREEVAPSGDDTATETRQSPTA